MTATKKHPVIALSSVESSQIESIGHHPESNTLAIKFKGLGGKEGSVYHYANYTPEQFHAFKNAKSIGSHFKTSIKSEAEKHPYVKVI
jgi:hypothetical protein